MIEKALNLYRRFPCHMCDKEIDCDVFTIHVLIHPISDDTGHRVSVQIEVILKQIHQKIK